MKHIEAGILIGSVFRYSSIDFRIEFGNIGIFGLYDDDLDDICMRCLDNGGR